VYKLKKLGNRVDMSKNIDTCINLKN